MRETNQNHQYHPGGDHSNVDALSQQIYTISEQSMFPKTSADEVRTVLRTSTTSFNLLSNI